MQYFNLLSIFQFCQLTQDVLFNILFPLLVQGQVSDQISI